MDNNQDQPLHVTHTMSDLSEDVMVSVFATLTLRELTVMERVSQSFNGYSFYHYDRKHQILAADDIPSYEPYIKTCLKCRNLKVLDGSKGIQNNMSLIELDVLGSKLAKFCPVIEIFKNCGILTTIMMSSYMKQLVDDDHHEVRIKRIELYPGVMNEDYTSTELKVPFINSIRMIDKYATGLRQLIIEGSYEWTQEMVKESSVMRSIGSRLKSVRINYQMMYDSLYLKRSLSQFDSSFTLRDADLNYLNVNHPKLEILKIRCPKDEQTFVNCLSLLAKLKYLELRQLTSGIITDYPRIFKEFLEIRGSQLTELSLVCVYVNLSGVWELIPKYCPHLKVLKINRYWAGIKDDEEIVKCILGLHDLKRLEMVDFVFRGFTKVELKQLNESLPNLRSIRYEIKTNDHQKSDKLMKMFQKEIDSYNVTRKHPIIVSLK